MAVEGCKECGSLDSSLRIYEFYDGERGVWCSTHSAHLKLGGDVSGPDGERPFVMVVPQTNADFLTDLARELERRGDRWGAGRARLQAETFQRETDKALKEIGQYPPRDSGPPTVPPFLGF